MAQPGQAANAEVVSGSQYAALREDLLKGTTHVTHSAGLMDYQAVMCPSQGSGLYRIDLTHAAACAAVDNWEQVAVVKELLCAPEDREEAMAAVAALCGREAEIRLPAGREEGEAFAAIKWLYAAAPSRWKNLPEGWFGPGFD